MTTINQPHTFHIPVMGTGFTIDTPLRIAKYGISSVLSIVDDILIEQMRKYHCEQNHEPYEPILNHDHDARAKRITAYLNLLDKLIHQQAQMLQAESFEDGKEINRYFSLLPNGSLKKLYQSMLEETAPQKKSDLQQQLRQQVVTGSIDVNIMTKLNRDKYIKGEKQSVEYADALSALRGYANSSLTSSIVFSAGLNPVLYGYMTQFNDFFPDVNGFIKKKIILKVSDYRSAVIQGKFLAKKGLWISEYRIESALNCGGHAFANDGTLMGPILDEFKQKKPDLIDFLHGIYQKALEQKGLAIPKEPLPVRITVQGGIGTFEEDQFLLHHYQLDGTGWATPFLLVPEVTNIDEKHLQKMIDATDADVSLNTFSPLGIYFWNLLTSDSEQTRKNRIHDDNPGSTCPKGYLRFNTEFTKIPLCPASRAYLKLKKEALKNDNLSPEKLANLKENMLNKSCICHDLSGSVLLKYDIKQNCTPAICCGPNIANFSKVASLDEMVDHIYGRTSLMTNPNRPHMFIKELMLHANYLKDEVEHYHQELPSRPEGKLLEVKKNLADGIQYYRILAKSLNKMEANRFLEHLDEIEKQIEGVII